MKEFLSHSDIPERYVKEMNSKELPFTLGNAVAKLTNILDSL